MSVMDSITTDVLLAAAIGLALGLIISYLILKPKKEDDDLIFSPDEMDRWHLDESWADILTKPKEERREWAIKELETIDEILKKREDEYKVLKTQIRKTSEEFQNEIDLIENMKVPAMKFTAAQTTLASLTSVITRLRKKTEAHVNALLPTEWRQEFLTCVRDEMSKTSIAKTLNRESIIKQINDSSTKQIEYFHAELDGLLGKDEVGTKKVLNDLFGPIF